MGTRFHDYDAAFAEAAATPIVIRLFGTEWSLPATMPAAFPLAVTRYIAEGRDPNVDLTMGELLELTRLLVPEDIMQAWLDQGLSLSQAVVILTDLMEDYGYTVPPEPEGEAHAPPGATPTPTSSSTSGSSSKPISNGSTESTSAPSSDPSVGGVS